MKSRRFKDRIRKKSKKKRILPQIFNLYIIFFLKFIYQTSVCMSSKNASQNCNKSEF